MESVKVFFDYRVMTIGCGCGLPSVTIEGTAADWERILEKIDCIETYDLTWWAQELKPIIQEIIKTKKGNIDKAFWKNMLQVGHKAVYAPHETIDGWIVKFYPFNDKGERRDLEPITHTNAIAAEYVKVPFVLEDRTTKQQYAMEFWAGLFGLEQDPINFKLKPVIGWAVAHSEGQNPVTTLPKESYDNVSLKNIMHIPQQFFKLREIRALTLGFIGRVNIPDQIRDIKIGKMYVTGDINAEEVKRIQALLPDTWLYIHGQLIAIVDGEVVGMETNNGKNRRFPNPSKVDSLRRK